MRIAAIVILALLVGVAARATRATTQGRSELFEIRVDGKGRRALLKGPDAVTPVADISRDGKRILFTDGDIFVANIDGSHKRLIARGSNAFSVPVFSPDGRRVAFQGEYGCFDGGCYERDVWLVNTNGTGLRRFADDAIAPAWSADSRKLAYLGEFCWDCQSGALTVANVSGPRRARKIVPVEQAQDGSSKLLFSPLGDRLAYALDGQRGREIRITRLDGRIVRFPGNEPSWSPDGRTLAFISSHPPTSVYVRRPGGRRRWLAAGSSPVWSPDGRWIAFVHGSRCAQISVIRPSGRGRRRLTHEPCGAGYQIFWLPDSKRLIYQRSTY